MSDPKELQTELSAVREKLVQVSQEAAKLREMFGRLQSIIDAQAEIPGLFEPMYQTPIAAGLQNALKVLTAGVRNETQNIYCIGYAKLSTSSPLEIEKHGQKKELWDV